MPKFIGLESEIHAISEYGTTYRIYAGVRFCR